MSGLRPIGRERTRKDYPLLSRGFTPELTFVAKSGRRKDEGVMP